MVDKWGFKCEWGKDQGIWTSLFIPIQMTGRNLIPIHPHSPFVYHVLYFIVKILYLIGPNGLVNPGFSNLKKKKKW